MADTFPVSGNIDPTSFPHLLVDLHRHGATGSLKVNGPVFPKALYFRGGRILFGSSNDPRDQLGAILIESGKITREQLDDVNAKVGPGNPLAKVLAESGFVNQRELGDAARVKVERILSDVLSWDSGSFEFEDGVLPKGAVDLKLSTERLLLAAVQRIGDRGFALRHLGGDLSVVLEPTGEGEATLSEVRAEVWPLLERLDGTRSLADAVALTRLDEFAGAKTACAMLFLGIVRRRPAGGGDELDLAAEARDGFGDESAPALGEPLAGAGQSTLPEGEPLGVVAEPAGDADEPLGVRDESPGGADEFLGVRSEPAEPEPKGFAMSEPESTGFAMPEPETTGFAFSEPETEPTSFGAELGIMPGPKFPAPVETAEPEPMLDAEPVVPGPDDDSGFADGDMLPEPPSPADEPTVQLPPPSPPAIDFAVPPPRRPEIDTVPGDRPVYVPPAAPPPDVAPPPAPPAPSPSDTQEPPPPSARPTQEDLAALDALLHPAAPAPRDPVPEATPVPSPSGRFEPRFRSAAASQARMPRPTPRRDRAPSRSRTPLIAAGLGLVVALAAAGYYFLGRPTAAPGPTPPPTTLRAAATPALSAPATVAPQPSPTLPAGGVVGEGVPAATAPAPDAAATPSPPATAAAVPATPRPATPAPTPTPVAATPTPAPAPPSTAGSAATALGLLRQGDLANSARGFLAALSPGSGGRYSIQALVACAPETVQKAVANVSGEDLFILPVDLEGRACYRVCWGLYESKEGAEAAIAGLPAYFRQGGVRPRVTPLGDLLR
jgi:hypothetical protein